MIIGIFAWILVLILNVYDIKIDINSVQKHPDVCLVKYIRCYAFAIKVERLRPIYLIVATSVILWIY